MDYGLHGLHLHGLHLNELQLPEGAFWAALLCNTILQISASMRSPV